MQLQDVAVVRGRAFLEPKSVSVLGYQVDEHQGTISNFVLNPLKVRGSNPRQSTYQLVITIFAFTDKEGQNVMFIDQKLSPQE
jgi:hypothetical protein